MADQQGNVLRPVAQRRQRDLQHLQAVIEILAETLGGDFGFQVAIGGGDDAHIDGDFLLRTNRPDTPLLQHPQQLGLGGQRQFGNFVEKQRTAPGVVEQALAVLLGAGIGPLDVAEQFRLDQLGRNGGAIDRHERAVRPFAHAMQGTRGDLLAGAGLATEQHGGRRWRDALEPLADLDHQFRLANHALDIGGMGADFPAQHEVFPGQTGALETALDRIQHLGQ